MPRSWCHLSELATAALGYKSLQNRFYYVDAQTIASYGIEKEFLVPLLRLRDLSPKTYLQTPTPCVWLFSCNKAETDLRGTGALRYIRAMAKMPAAKKKQSRGTVTIQEALSEQGGGHWYAPKARPHRAHIWMRKALGTCYAPFVCRPSVAVDQRCNYIAPRRSICHWDELAALMTSSIVALSIESSGASSMGAGALELKTGHLRDLRIPDIRLFSEIERQRGVELAEAVWSQERPLDWSGGSHVPGDRMRELDAWVLAHLNPGLSPERLYQDIADTCGIRIDLAKDKDRRVKDIISDDLRTVASGIAASVRHLIDARQFPEAFAREDYHLVTFNFPTNVPLTVEVTPILGQTAILVVDRTSGRELLDASYPRGVAEVITRALLLGRREFRAPEERVDAEFVLAESGPWLNDLIERIRDGSSSSAFGTRFEDRLYAAALNSLGVHAAVAAHELSGQFLIDPAPTATL